MSWPDSLYFQGKILEVLSNKKIFDKFVQRKKVSKDYLKGYFYLIIIGFYLWFLIVYIVEHKM